MEVLRAALVLSLVHVIAVGGDSNHVNDGGGRDPCVEEPTPCDGAGIDHLPLHQSLKYSLEGDWGLDLTPDEVNPTTSRVNVTLEAKVVLTRVSQCRVKIVLSDVLSSDAQPDEGPVAVETWVTVNGGAVVAVCGRDGPHTHAHAHALARSVVSATLSVAPDTWDMKDKGFMENDHHGACMTRYSASEMAPDHYSITRTRDPSSCTTPSHNTIAQTMTWRCHQRYLGAVPARFSRGSTLQKVTCHQNLTLEGTASFVSHLNLVLVEALPRPFPYEELTGLRLLNLTTTTQTPHQDTPPIDLVRGHLRKLCNEVEQRVTLDATLAYSSLVTNLRDLSKDEVIEVFKQVIGGGFCPSHGRVRHLYEDALRDSTSPSSAAAKCELMLSGAVPLRSSWLTSLAAVTNPTVEAITTCTELLEGDGWEEAVLGVAAMAGHAARTACVGVRGRRCFLDGEQCGLAGGEECSLSQSVVEVIDQLASHLSTCATGDAGNVHQTLLALRGLGSIGAYGRGVEEVVRVCGGDVRVREGVRVAAIETLGQGPCFTQTTNWLKWEVLNTTLGADMRIAAFRSLLACDSNEAEDIAALIIKKESDTQVKSYISSIVPNYHEENVGDARQFSRHYSTNLSTLAGLPRDTMLDADVVFQSSFLPRSLNLNLSSPLLNDFGGSTQLGIRLENLEEVIQNLFGHNGSVDSGVVEWLGAVVHKIQEMFNIASREFVETHQRNTRSYDADDVKALLAKVKHEVVTELRGWVYAGLGGQDRLFSSFSIDPLALQWETLMDQWINQLLQTTYTSLINSNVDTVGGWAAVDQQVVTWSLLGTPVILTKKMGGVMTLGAASKVDLLSLLSLLTYPNAATLDVALSPSLGVYRVSEVRVVTRQGEVSAHVSAPTTAGFDIAAVLTVQSGGDSIDLKLDFPDSSYQGTSSKVVRTLHYPSMNEASELAENDGSHLDDDAENSDCREDEIVEQSNTSFHQRSCSETLDNILALRSRSDMQWVRGKHSATLRKQNYIQKAEHSITGYRMAFNWKNPGVNSMFLDVHMEAEGGSVERKVGLVFGLTYSPHFTLKVLIHSQQFSASAEVTLVNDPNLKRIEAHIGYGKIEYGIKAELLMVTDGGQVSVKPRLVVSYPGTQEDALLEGYMARYWSEKVRSFTLDLFTEGTLKELLNASLKGTVEYRTPATGDKVLTIKNFHFAALQHTLGLEAAFGLKNNTVEGQIQATWGGQVVVVDGSAIDLGSGMSDQHYEANLQFLLPDHPHMDTRLTYMTKIYENEVTNNLTLAVGPEATRRDFQVIHSTSWRFTKPSTPILSPGHEQEPSQSLSHTHEPAHAPAHAYLYSGMAAKIINKVGMKSRAMDLDWTLEHVLQMTDRSLENILNGQLGDQTYKIMANLYDQTEDLFKYHAELEMSLPAWHFSYVDTLEQRYEGDVVGQSTTVMPSGRVYSSSSRYFKGWDRDKTMLDFSYDILVQDGAQSWKIAVRESFEWSTSHLSLHMGVELGDITLFGLELTLDGLSTMEVEMDLKTWVKRVFEGEVAFTSHGGKMDLSFILFLVPFNREIKSKVALGHDGCARGTVDGELAWDARADTSKTVTFSSTVQLPEDTRILVLAGSMSVLSWTWKTQLEVEFGRHVGDNHRVAFIVTLPDSSSFEAGSQLNFAVTDNDLALFTNFDVRLPSGNFHNLTALVQGQMANHGLLDGVVTLIVDSPATRNLSIDLHVKKHNTEGRSDVGITVSAKSEAGYWEPIEGHTTWVFDGTRSDLVSEMSWGQLTLNLDATGSYKLVGGEHQVMGSLEVRVPGEAAISWRQLKTTLAGTFSVEDNPNKLQMSHNILVYKDYEVVVRTDGEGIIQVPNVEGRLSLTHTGNVAASHLYTITGTFTGQELLLEVKGTVDETPVQVFVHYIDGKELTVNANYRGDNYLSVAFKTELKDVSFGIRKGNGTSFSLTSDGQVVFRGRRTKLNHQLSVSPTKASSSLRLSPFMGEVFKLTTSRTKHSLHRWGTNIAMSWGTRNFTYHDYVHFRSYRDCTIQMEIDAPDLGLDEVTTKVESHLDGDGDLMVQAIYLVQNSTLHSARMTYYIQDAPDEQVWRAALSELVVGARPYSDLGVAHIITLPGDGVQIRSNMTIGETPVVGVSVTITPETRALLLSVCSTSEECVRLRTHAHASSTPSTRTFSVSAHALNSLLWRAPTDPLLQNSVTFTAEETANEVMVTGGIRRVECGQVVCNTFVDRNLLHATLRLTPDTLDILLDTTNRTVQLLTVARQNIVSENSSDIEEITMLPGGHLVSSTSLETSLWLDKNNDPQGAITWNSTVAHYASSRAAEWAVRSRLHHDSFDKMLRVGGNIVADTVSSRAAMLLDVFSAVEDALKLDIEIMHDHGSQVLVANLTRTTSSSPRVIDMVASFLPSPDSAEVSVVLLVPHWAPGTHHHQESQYDARFSLSCGLDAGHTYRHATAHCTLTTPSVREKIDVGYQIIEHGVCNGFSTSLGMFNKTYQAEQKSCLSPTSIQASLALKTPDKLQDELALRLGLVDERQAELDFLDAAHVKFQLHPPFLLHAMAHSRGTLRARWNHLKEGAHEEFDDIFRSGMRMVRAMASDMDLLDGLAQVSRPSPVSHLAAYTRTQVMQMVTELKYDELLNDLAHMARACVDITSIMIEAIVTYVTHNFGDPIIDVVMAMRAWGEATVMNVGSFMVQVARGLRDTFVSSVTYLSYLPQRILYQVKTVPVIAKAIEWVERSVQYLQSSQVYKVFVGIGRSTVHYTHKALSVIYPWTGIPYKEDVVAGVWNIWVPLPECSHSLFDIWNMVNGSARMARHKFTLLSAVQRWWQFLINPVELFHHVTPPFPAYGAVIGDTNFITLDGLTYSIIPSCPHVLVTDTRDGLFTLVSSTNNTRGREYTLVMGDQSVQVLPDLQVSVDGSVVSLPYHSGGISVTRNLQTLTLVGRDDQRQDLLKLTCWWQKSVCVVSVSGWLHADVRGLLGHYDNDPTNELMRPSGKVALSGEVFSQSWQVGTNCRADKVNLELPPDTRAQYLCQQLLMHHTSAVYPCHDYVDVQPFYQSCVRHLVNTRQEKSRSRNQHRTPSRSHRRSSRRKPRRVPPHMPEPINDDPASVDNSSGPQDQPPTRPSFSSLFFRSREGQAEATSWETEAVCDAIAAYSSVCSKYEVNFGLPRPCGRKGRLTYQEPPVSPRQLDVVLLVDENECADFEYRYLVGPLPAVLNRIAHAKNISDVKMALLGYGAGGGDVTYYVNGKDFLTSHSRLPTQRPQDPHLSRASLLLGMRAISNFPFRPGSVRVGVVVRCSDQDLPEFTDSLPREMKRRRLTLFTLTPDLLVFDPARPKAVRNTIGVDRWRVYTLRNDNVRTKDSWDVRMPNSNVAQLAMKSGGGVFTIKPLREEDKLNYYMKLFRKTLAKAIVKAANTAYNQTLTH